MQTLSSKILKRLSIDLKLADQTIRNNISKLAQQYPGVTPNVLAFMFAQQKGISILNMLTTEERRSVPTVTNNNFPPALSNPKSLRIIQIGKKTDRFYNHWLFQLCIVGIGAGRIAQVLGIFIARKLGIY